MPNQDSLYERFNPKKKLDLVQLLVPWFFLLGKLLLSFSLGTAYPIEVT